MIKHRLRSFAWVSVLVFASFPSHAADYDIDPAHSFVEFKILHLGYSVLKGRFNTLHGTFSYDADHPKDARISVEVETASIDSNHAKRDKHLRNKDFLDVETYPLATFKSTHFQEKGKTGIMTGDLTIRGITKQVDIPVELIGFGSDPWGGHRRGYQGHIQIKRADYGINHDLGPAAETMTLDLFIEGIRK